MNRREKAMMVKIEAAVSSLDAELAKRGLKGWSAGSGGTRQRPALVALFQRESKRSFARERSRIPTTWEGFAVTTEHIGKGFVL